MGKVGAGDNCFIRTSLCRMLRRRGGVEPIAKLESFVPKIFLTRQRGDIIYPGVHTFELVRKYVYITISFIQHPRDNGRGISPGSRTSVAFAQCIGNNMGYSSSQLVLLDRQILEPGLQE